MAAVLNGPTAELYLLLHSDSFIKPSVLDVKQQTILNSVLVPIPPAKQIPSKFSNLIENNIYEEHLFKKLDGTPEEAGDGADYSLSFQFNSDN
jgi:hypothetical protein